MNTAFCTDAYTTDQNAYNIWTKKSQFADWGHIIIKLISLVLNLLQTHLLADDWAQSCFCQVEFKSRLEGQTNKVTD